MQILGTYGCCRSIEWLVGCPEGAEWQEAFLCQLLVQASMGETDGKHISQVADGDERWKSSGTGTVTKDIAKEDTCNNDFGRGELGLGDGGKIRN